MPFDPGRAYRPLADPNLAYLESATLSVRQVNELVRGAIARHLPPTLHVLGEIGDLSRPVSGHLYLTLKDAVSELRCVMWRSTAVRLRFQPEVGMEVIATGSLEVYAQRGVYQLIVRKLEPRGVGELEVAFRQLRERLQREGLFDPRRKKPLPRVPERVALVTSPTGAAIRDILQTLKRRFPAVEVLVFPVRVQGDGAAEEIASAIRLLNTWVEELGGIDVIITGRGGGALEDLWAFNEEVVARAIAASRIPIVSAVGHEVDVSISDLVADLRAPTPTAAAELITPSAAELAEILGRQAARAERALRHTLQLAAAHLDHILARDSLARPTLRLRQRGQLIDELEQRLRLGLLEGSRRARELLNAAEVGLLRFASGRRFSEAARGLERRVHQLWRLSGASLLAAQRWLNQLAARLDRASPRWSLARLADRLESFRARAGVAAQLSLSHSRTLLAARLQAVTACDPERILRRGYSITRDARTREVIRSVRQVRENLRVVTQLADGEFRSTAEDPKQPRLFE